jgi:TPP-dependent pyruvate/acetoin dehydrogenase alpha subunit
MSEIQRMLSGDVAAVDRESLGLGDAELARMYEAMTTTRALDERSARLHADGEIGFYVASRGLEAVSVGAGFTLEAPDWLFPSHRDLGMYLLRGGSMRAWFDQLFGNAADLTRGRQLPGHASLPAGRFVSVSGRIGPQISQAAGCAMAIKSRRDEACVMTSFGEAASSAADFHAALSIAARFRVPAVFVCRSARRAAAAEVGGAAPVAARATAYGVSSGRVDGSDVLAVYRAVSEARSTAIEGGGPTLIEAVLDDAALFGDGAPSAGAAPSSDVDPVARLREYLEQCGSWDAAREEELGARLRDRIEEAVAAARAEAKPPADSLFHDVYCEVPWMLQEQRERLLGGEGD